MTQILRATGGISGGAATLQSIITTLKNNMALGKSITAADINQLIITYNSWINHTHNVSDLRGIDNYGNVSHYGSTGTYVAKVSTTVSGAVSATLLNKIGFPENPGDLTIDTNSRILATDTQDIVPKINSIRTHTHEIVDTID